MRCKLCKSKYSIRTKKYFVGESITYCRGCLVFNHFGFGHVGLKTSRFELPEKLDRMEWKKLYKRLLRAHQYANDPEFKRRVNQNTIKFNEDNPSYHKIYASEHREYNKLRMKQYAQSNRLKTRARATVGNAVKSGKLVKPLDCSKCQSKLNIEADHHDYSKPLDVTWLCRVCHRKLTSQRKLDGIVL
jgi:hypothetical protein